MTKTTRMTALIVSSILWTHTVVPLSTPVYSVVL